MGEGGEREAALVLVGHGSVRNTNVRLATDRLAEDIRSRHVFVEVRTCFWKEPLYIRDVLAEISARHVFVVPNFAGEGVFTEEVIPRELGLLGRDPQWVRSALNVHHVVYTAPVGTHPRIGVIVRRQVGTVLAAEGLDPATVCLLLVGHGSSRPGGSGKTAESLATMLLREGGVGEVRTAFLEQMPSVSAWPMITALPNVIVIPLLISEGLHGSEDLPPLFGIKASDLKPGRPVASRISGRSVWYCPAIGGYAEIADIILDLVRMFQN